VTSSRAAHAVSPTESRGRRRLSASAADSSWALPRSAPLDFPVGFVEVEGMRRLASLASLALSRASAATWSGTDTEYDGLVGPPSGSPPPPGA
jgi:hypothetical protein